jgi:hypothetical protein
MHVDSNHVSPILLAHIFTHVFLRYTIDPFTLHPATGVVFTAIGGGGGIE